MTGKPQASRPWLIASGFVLLGLVAGLAPWYVARWRTPQSTAVVGPEPVPQELTVEDLLPTEGFTSSVTEDKKLAEAAIHSLRKVLSYFSAGKHAQCKRRAGEKHPEQQGDNK